MGKPSIEEWIGITDLFTRYACALDKGDVETICACFTEDAVVDSPIMGSFKGAAAIRAFAEKNADYRRKGGQMRHIISNIRMDVVGNRARAWAYLLNTATWAGKSEIVSPGEYDCSLIKVNGDWRFDYRLVALDQPAKIAGRD